MVKDFLNNIILQEDIRKKMENVTSSLTKLPPILNRTINWWKKNLDDKKVIRCKKFNRRDNWGLTLIYRWFESILGFFTINPLVYVHIKSCIDHCTKQGKIKDVEYFQNYYDKGYNYITVEGGNRHDTTGLFYKMFPEYRTKRINLCIAKSIDRATMHEIYIRMSHGNSPNRQEIRTGIYGILSDKVRDISEKCSKIFFKRIENVNAERMVDDELIAKSYGYTKYQSLGDNLDDKIDDDYRAKTPSNIQDWLVNMTSLKNFFTNYNKIVKTKQLGKGFYYAVLFTLDWMRRKEIKVNKWVTFVKDFSKWFGLMMVDDTIYYSKGNKKYTFADMVRNNKTKAVKNKILELCKVEIWSYCVNNVCNEATPRVQKDFYDRVILYKHFDYKPKLRINGELNGEWFENGEKKGVEYRDEILTYEEIIDSEITVIEHIGSLRKNKNADELVNQEFSTPEYNSWKSDKV